MLSAEQARLLATTKSEAPTDQWKPLFLQIEAAALSGANTLDCMEMRLPPGFDKEELKALVTALGYKWTAGPYEHFEISWQ